MKKLLFVLLLIPAFISAQELDANVIINYEQLSNSYKEKLVDFKNEVENYLNNNQFSGQPWEWAKIKCNFNIFFTSASNETQYSAQVVITSQRPLEGRENHSLMLSILESGWKFEYEQNQAFYFNPTVFDPLTSFLDFFAFMIIGWDSDSYEPYGGSDYFKEALNIAVQGSNSAYSDGWVSKSSAYNKRAWVEELLEANFQQFRQDFYDYHYNGLDLYYQNKKKTYQSIEKLVNNLAELKNKINRRSVLLNVFFEAKSGEIIDYMKEWGNESVFEQLKKVDPQRISKYMEAVEE